MKHLLNNLSEEEKNRIREQHRGNAKPFLSEQDKPKYGEEGYRGYNFTERDLINIMNVLKNGGIDFGMVAQLPNYIISDNGNGWGMAYNHVYFPNQSKVTASSK